MAVETSLTTGPVPGADVLLAEDGLRAGRRRVVDGSWTKGVG
ncbi:hypothetical protein [Streptomyces katsurahamanus]|nr:hypothetical protein [Streptomyces katsurahamanus]